MKTHFAQIILAVVLLVACVWGWRNYFRAELVHRGDLREACYLASEFTVFCHSNDRAPTADEAANFATRLEFVELRDQRYVYRCGLRGQDALIIFVDAQGQPQFLVGGNALSQS